ncbi:hypothetical protein StoSoilB5_21310 [Arthrobacter sp. StoSoilB5]|nr:hypothetical protein StoSoilB5_21310 [Arthrobacter sp. StoSoilB5]
MVSGTSAGFPQPEGGGVGIALESQDLYCAEYSGAGAGCYELGAVQYVGDSRDRDARRLGNVMYG